MHTPACVPRRLSGSDRHRKYIQEESFPPTLNPFHDFSPGPQPQVAPLGTAQSGPSHSCPVLFAEHTPILVLPASFFTCCRHRLSHSETCSPPCLVPAHSAGLSTGVPSSAKPFLPFKLDLREIPPCSTTKTDCLPHPTCPNAFSFTALITSVMISVIIYRFVQQGREGQGLSELSCAQHSAYDRLSL